MNLALVVGSVVSTLKHPAYTGRKLLLIQPIQPDGTPKGPATIAVDYVGAGAGETVLYGKAPGLAKTVFHVSPAPMNELIMGIVDRVKITEDRR
jgi:ethanolamine utilization protein EutN